MLLLTADGAPRRLAETDFARLCRDDRVWRVPEFADQRIRWASLVVELFNRQPIRVVHRSLGFLQFDDTGRLDVDRMNRDQVARVDVLVTQVLASRPKGTVIDASIRFAARGGTWRPDADVSARINAAALGRLPCPRIKLEA
jgi:hypothetical protein